MQTSHLVVGHLVVGDVHARAVTEKLNLVALENGLVDLPATSGVSAIGCAATPNKTPERLF